MRTTLKRLRIRTALRSVLLLILALPASSFAGERPERDWLPSSADTAALLDIDGVVGTFRPEVVRRVLLKSLGRWITDGGEGRLLRMHRAGVSALLRGTEASEVYGLIHTDLSPADILDPIQSANPGLPDPDIWTHRGTRVTTLVPVPPQAISVARITEGPLVVASHPDSGRTLVRSGLETVGDASRGYPWRYPGALSTTALMSLHLAHPRTLASVPGLEKIPWKHIVKGELELVKASQSLDLGAELEASSWLKAKIMLPILRGKLDEAINHPRVAEPLKDLLRKLKLEQSGKTITGTAHATVAQIENLLLWLTRPDGWARRVP